MTRLGELGVQIATTIEDIDDTTSSLAEDEKFLLELQGLWHYQTLAPL